MDPAVADPAVADFRDPADPPNPADVPATSPACAAIPERVMPQRYAPPPRT
ncbi:hypothetical protein FAIPA1_20020 [Frankia sp. AiPs1]